MSTRDERLFGELPSGEVNAARLSEILGVPHGTVKRWRHEGLPGRKEGHHLWIDVAAAKAWLVERFGALPTPRTSVVYVAQRLEDSAVKVGWSSDVMRRIFELRKVSASAVELVACVPGTKPVELRVHDMLRDYRLDGEWFACSPEVAVRALLEVA